MTKIDGGYTGPLCAIDVAHGEADSRHPGESMARQVGIS